MSHTTECRYPCGCDQFPEDHCACMDGHTAPDPTPGEVGLSEEVRAAIRDAFLGDGRSGVAYALAEGRAERVIAAVERILAERTAALQAEVEGLRRERDDALTRADTWRDENDKASELTTRWRERAEAAEAEVAELPERIARAIEKRRLQRRRRWMRSHRWSARDEAVWSQAMWDAQKIARRAALGGEHDGE